MSTHTDSKESTGVGSQESVERFKEQTRNWLRKFDQYDTPSMLSADFLRKYPEQKTTTLRYHNRYRFFLAKAKGAK